MDKRIRLRLQLQARWFEMTPEEHDMVRRAVARWVLPEHTAALRQFNAVLFQELNERKRIRAEARRRAEYVVSHMAMPRAKALRSPLGRSKRVPYTGPPRRDMYRKGGTGRRPATVRVSLGRGKKPRPLSGRVRAMLLKSAGMASPTDPCRAGIPSLEEPRI